MPEKKPNEHVHLSQDDIKDLLRMKEEFARCKWLYGLLATVSAWAAGVATFIYVTQDFVAKLYKALRVALGAP